MKTIQGDRLAVITLIFVVMARRVHSNPGNHWNPMFVAEFQAFPPEDWVMDDSAIFRNAKVGAGRGSQYFHQDKILGSP